MIPLIRPSVPRPSEIDIYFQESIDKGQYTNFGPNYAHCRFLLDIKFFGRYHAIVSDGTNAISLAIKTLIKDGVISDVPKLRAIVPMFTHYGSVAGCFSGGVNKVVFAPTSKKTWILDYDYIKENAMYNDIVVVVAPFGIMPDMKKWDSLARQKGFNIIYDFAGGFGGQIKTQFPVCYSLHATKGFAIGEGGIVSFNSAGARNICERLSNFSTTPNRYIDSYYGVNSKLDELRSSALRHQLINIDNYYDKLQNRLDTYVRYQDALSDHAYSPFKLTDYPSLCVFHFDKAPRDFEEQMLGYGITIKQYYIPLSSMSGLNFIKKLDLSVENKNYFSKCFALPTDVTRSEREKVIEKCLKILS